MAINTDTTIVYHLGAPNTDEEQITRSMRSNIKLLAENGVLKPWPKDYRPLINELVKELEGDEPTVEEQETLFNVITRGQDLKRVILSNPKFLGVPNWMFSKGKFYGNAAKNTAALRNIFYNNPHEFFLGIANPASFIPSVFKTVSGKTYEQFMDGMNLANVRWSDVISRIQYANPGCPITVWCNEDSPIIWPIILHKIANVDPMTRMKGEEDIINNIISEEGQTLLAKYLADRPNLTEAQRRRLRIVFLERFYLSDVVEEVIDLPGWTDETVEALTNIYDDDVNRIKQMDGVTFLSP